jgi:hypothetical protein
MDRYGEISRVDYHQNHLETVYGLGAYSYRAPIRDATVSVELKFFGSESFERFFQVHQEQQLEAQLREKSPTLQKAWEEYQLLLKLSK